MYFLSSRPGWPITLMVGLALALACTPALWGGCGYFAAKDKEVWQLGQTVFLGWDPQTKLETLVIQPAFESKALDFVTIIPTPSRPKLQPMPRAFFRHLDVFTRLKHRELPKSKLLSVTTNASKRDETTRKPANPWHDQPRVAAAAVLEAGVVGVLDYKIIRGGWADALFKWLKDNRYAYAGAEATLNAYVQKGWFFTVLKIDPAQMRKNRDGSYTGAVAPMRIQFTTEKLVYPLRIAQTSVREPIPILFYVQAPFKVELPGEKRTPTRVEWAKRLSDHDIKLLRGEAPYSEPFPDVDDGFVRADLKDPRKAEAVFRVIRQRLERARQDQPRGYLVRRAAAEDVQGLRELAEHLRAGQFLTRFRKTLTQAELAADLELTAARLGNAVDSSEYTETLPPN